MAGYAPARGGRDSAFEGPDAGDDHRKGSARRFVRDLVIDPGPEQCFSKRSDRRSEQIAGNLVFGRSYEVFRCVTVPVFDGNNRADLYSAGICNLANLGLVQYVPDLPDPRFLHALLILGSVVVGVLADIAVRTGFRDAFRYLVPGVTLQMGEFLLQFLVSSRREPGGLVGHERAG